MTWNASRLSLVIGAVMAVGAGAATASTLDAVTLGSSLVSADGLEVISDDASIEATDLFSDIFVFAPIDGGAVDATLATDTDLSIFDATFTEILGGTAFDIGADASANTISILYDLIINEKSGDPFAVAVLSFDVDIEDGILGFLGELDGKIVSIEVFSATNSPDVSAIPLPASLFLLLGGLGLIVVARKRGAMIPNR